MRLPRLIAAGAAGMVLAALPALPAAAAGAPAPLTPTHACPAAEVPGSWMVDVPAASNAYADVDCVVWWGVAEGEGAFHYAPGQAVSRGQMALFVSRVITASGGTLPTPSRDYFTDDNGTVYEAADNALAAAGIVDGVGPGLYAPSRPVSRAEMAKFLFDAASYRIHGSVGTPPTASTSYFSDVRTGTSVADDIMAVANAGYASGFPDGTYRPDLAVTRAEMAIFLSRLLEGIVTDPATSNVTMPPVPPANPAPLLTYVADRTQVYEHPLTGGGADTLLYTAPAGATVTGTALAPDGSAVALAQSTFDSAGNAVAGDTHVFVVPTGTTTTSPTSVGGTALADGYVDHLSWAGGHLIASAVNAQNTSVLYTLDPTGAAPPQQITAEAGSDCAWAQALPDGAVLYSECNSAAAVLGSATGVEYGPVLRGDTVDIVQASPTGREVAYSDYSASGTTDSLDVAPAVLGSPTQVAQVSTGAGTSSTNVIDEIAWQDPATVLYSLITVASTGPTGGQIYQVPADGSAAPAGVGGLQAAGSQWGLSSYPG